MILSRGNKAFPVLTAIAVGGLLMVALPSVAASASDSATAKAASGATDDKAAAKPINRAEARIKELHAKLRITPAQEPQWNNLVQVMRDNAQKMSDLIEQRDRNAKTATAVDDLKSYEEITDAHDDGLKKLVPAFQALYDSLSDAQKKTADSIFRGDIAKRSAS